MFDQDCVEKIAKDVCQKLGAGHREAVYKQAFLVALRHVHKAEGFQYDCERVVRFTYEDHCVGWGNADIVVRDCDGSQIVLELKKGNTSPETAKQQCQNYMYFLSKENDGPIEKGFVIGFPSSEEEDPTSASETVDEPKKVRKKKKPNSVWVEKVGPRKN